MSEKMPYSFDQWAHESETLHRGHGHGHGHGERAAIPAPIATIGTQIGSKALRADGSCSIVCAYMAGL